MSTQDALTPIRERLDQAAKAIADYDSYEISPADAIWALRRTGRDANTLLGAVESVLALVPHFNVTIDHGNGVTENLGATLKATIHQHLGEGK